MYMTCPACKKPVEENASKCPHCGIKIATPAKPLVAKPIGESDLSHDVSPVETTWETHLHVGLDAIGLGEYSQALASLNQAIISAPEDDLAICYSTRGYAYLCLEQFERAVDDCGQAIDRDPSDGEAFAWRASAHAGLAHWRQAVDDFSRAVKLSPENAAEYREVARAHSEQALADIRESVRAGNASAQLFQDRGVIYAFRGDNEKALRDFTQSIEADATIADTFAKRAECFATAGEHDRVIEDCTRAIELGYDDADVYRMRSAALEQQGQTAQALADLDQVVQRQPTCEALLRRGELRQASGDCVAAIDDYSAALDIDPEASDVLAARGAARCQLEQFKAAIQDYSAALDLVAADPETLILRGETHLKLKQFDLALADFDEAMRLDAVTAAALCGRGQALAGLGRRDEAINELNKSLRLDTKYGPAYAGRANVRLEQKKTEEALADYDKAIGLGLPTADAAAVYYKRGVAYLELRQLEKAISDFDESIKLNDRLPGTFVWRGTSLANLGQFRPAVADFERAMELNPGDRENYRKLVKPFCERAVEYYSKIIQRESQQAHGYRDRGIAHEFLGAPDDAVQDFTTALQFDARDLDALTRRAGLFAQQGNYPAAIDDHSAALELSRTATTLARRGECYQQAGEAKQALTDFDAAIELEPDSASGYVARGRLLAATNKPSQALADFTQAIRLDWRQSDAQLERARVFMSRRKPSEALRDFESVIDADPNHAEAHLGRAEVKIQLQKLDDALADLDRALELDRALARAHCSRALLLARRAEFEMAVIQLTKALARFREDPAKLAMLLDCRAKIYYNASRFRRAIADYTSVLQLKPPEYNLAQTLYGRGVALLQIGAEDQAERSFAKAVEERPGLQLAKSALRWLEGDRGRRPAELQPPTNKVPPQRPPKIRESVEVSSSREDAGEPPWDEWLVVTAAEVEYGPVKKSMLDTWCAEGRLDEAASVLRVDWDNWRWASEVYPELDPAYDPTEDASTAADANAEPPDDDVEEFPQINI